MEYDSRATFLLPSCSIGLTAHMSPPLSPSRPALEERLRACTLDGVTTTVCTDPDTGAVVGVVALTHSLTEVNHLRLPPPPPQLREDPKSSIAPRYLLSDVKVSPRWRRRGVASRLLRHLEDEVSSHGALVSLFVARDNLPAKRLYKKFDYIESEEGLPKDLLDLANISPFEVQDLHYLVKYIKRRPGGQR